MARLLILSGMFAVSVFAAGGCSAETQAETAVREERVAVHAAMEYFSSVGLKVDAKTPLLEGIAQWDDDTKEVYARSIARVPLDGCSAEVKRTIRRYIAAWESRETGRIKAAWLDVVATAKRFGVDENGALVGPL